MVGAGPGGCATAITAASQGLRVCLLDAADFPRARPGETLHPGVDLTAANLANDGSCTSE